MNKLRDSVEDGQSRIVWQKKLSEVKVKLN